jgi:anti-sigma-K factor RskA
MNGAEQERREELASLYALGVITASEHVELQTELKAAPELNDLIRSLSHVSVGLTQSVPLVDPPLALRARVLTGVTGKRFTPVAVPGAVPSGTVSSGQAGPSGAPAKLVLHEKSSMLPAWLAAAAAVLIAVGVGAYALQLRNRVDHVEQQLAAAATRATQAEQDLVSLRRVLSDAQIQTQTLRLEAAVFMAPDMNRIDLAGQPVAPGASARAFWSRSRGVVFAASQLPALPAGKTYQLWFVPANAAPVSAGLITPDAQGSVTVQFATPPSTPDRIAALAVTLEPAGGVPAPTGDKYLVGAASN